LVHPLGVLVVEELVILLELGYFVLTGAHYAVYLRLDAIQSVLGYILLLSCLPAASPLVLCLEILLSLGLKVALKFFLQLFSGPDLDPSVV
jgi:hypothetical protein